MPPNLDKGLRASQATIVINAVLAVIKIATGIVGQSYALVADGVESTLDIASSFIVWIGLRVSARPADRSHPYGHGKAESLAALVVCLLLVAVALGIAYQSLREIRAPQQSPAPYTLVVLIFIIVIKEFLFQWMGRVGRRLRSTALQSDAWHHRSDALTSLAALVGISIALFGGPRYASADDWAALLACGVILWNGLRLLRHPLDEMMDAAAPAVVEAEIREIAAAVAGVVEVEKCRVRKSGTQYLVDIHITVAGRITVAQGHEIAHIVKDRLLATPNQPIGDVLVHVEPDEWTAGS